MTLSQWLARRLPDDVIADEAERRDMPRYKDPVDELEQLDDDPHRVYVWEVSSEERAEGWIKSLEEYRDKHGGFDAIHFVLTDEEDIHRFSRDELREMIR